MINETIIQTVPVGYVPSYFMYIIIAVALLSFILLTIAYKTKKTDWGSFWQVILFSVFIIGITSWFLISMPDMLDGWVIKTFNIIK